VNLACFGVTLVEYQHVESQNVEKKYLKRRSHFTLPDSPPLGLGAHSRGWISSGYDMKDGEISAVYILKSTF
jgi:hypothetical protein